MPVITKKYAAILFDMDGTLIDSTNAIIAHWTRFGQDHGLDPSLILAASHGRRSIDVMKEFTPEIATWENAIALEAEIPKRNAEDARELPGARRLIEAIQGVKGKRAVVTSGTRVLAESWVKVMDLPVPEIFVTADQVEAGKPDPQGYRMACQLLNIPVDAPVLVVEDAPAGVKAGIAAGCDVLGLLTTHSRYQIAGAGATFIVDNLTSVDLETGSENWLKIKITVESVGELLD